MSKPFKNGHIHFGKQRYHPIVLVSTLREASYVADLVSSES